MKCPFKKQITKEFFYKPWEDVAVDKEIVITEFGECDESKCMAYNLVFMKCDLERGCKHE
jgi:hypothetical protein